MSKFKNLPIKKVVLLTLASIFSTAVVVGVVQFLYYNLFVEYFSNIGAMSSELNYYTKSELSDNYDIGFEKIPKFYL